MLKKQVPFAVPFDPLAGLNHAACGRCGPEFACLSVSRGGHTPTPLVVRRPLRWDSSLSSRDAATVKVSIGARWAAGRENFAPPCGVVHIKSHISQTHFLVLILAARPVCNRLFFRNQGTEL